MSRLYDVRFTRQAVKDFDTSPPKRKEKIKRLCSDVLQSDPYQGKKLMGELRGSYSLRLSYQDRLVYSIDEETQTVFVERCRAHYGD